MTNEGLRGKSDEVTREVIKKKVNAVFERYSLGNEVFLHPEELVGKQIAELITHYEISNLFTESSERIVLGLAIADNLIDVDTEEEFEALHAMFKLISTGVVNARYVTFSALVKRLSEEGDPSGRNFDPEAVQGNSLYEYSRKLNDYVQKFKDHDKSALAEQDKDNWSPEGLLYHARRRFSLTPETERSLQVVVLNQPGKAVKEVLGASAQCVYINGKGNIILPNDYSSRTFQHEYNHSQGGINRWYRNLLFKGTNEALTELFTPDPTTYVQQREALQVINDTTSGIEELWLPAYLKNEVARQTILKRIIAVHKTKGLLYAARLAALSDNKIGANLQESIFIPSEEVIRYFRR